MPLRPRHLRPRHLAHAILAVLGGVSVVHAATACGEYAAPSPFIAASGGAGGSGGADGGVGAGMPAVDPTLGGPCTVDSQCDDAVACTFDACDAMLSRCRFIPDDSSCQNAVVCDGQEVCSNKNGCVAGAPKTCSDGSPCTIDTCDAATGGCLSEPRDADGDGDPDIHCAGGDCDDEDPLVSSKQGEVCMNGADDDCDGVVDEPDCGKPTNDDCFAPLALAKPGSYAMSTVAAKLDYGSSCVLVNPAAARDVVAAVSIPSGPVDVTLTARTDSPDVTVTLSGTCAQPGSEVACSAGFPHATSGRVAKLRAHGVGGVTPSVMPVYVATDSPTAITLRYELGPATSAPANETCGTSALLLDGVPQKAPLVGIVKDLVSGCASATGELVYRFELSEPRDVDLFASSIDGDGRPALSLRTEGCALATDELTCNVAPNAGESAHVFRHALAPGVYFVAVAATAPTDALLTLSTSPPTALPIDETCLDSPALVPGVTREVALALHQDDVDTGCLTGGVDAAYALELAAPSDVLVVGRYANADAAAVVLALPGCTAAEEVACAVGNISPTRARAHALAAGSYRVVAESVTAQPMALTAFVRPAAPPKLVPFADACADALTIGPLGGFFQGNTSNAKADFDSGCDQGKQPKGSAPDQLLRLVLTSPKRVVFDMQGSGYPTLLAVRKGPACPGMELAKACAVGYYPDRSFLDLTLDAGTYFVQIDGFSGQYGPWFLDVFLADLPP